MKNWQKYMEEKQKHCKKLKPIQEMLMIWNAFLNRKCDNSIQRWRQYIAKVKEQWNESVYQGQKIFLRIILSFKFANRFFAGERVFKKLCGKRRCTKAWIAISEGFAIDWTFVQEMRSKYEKRRKFYAYCNCIRRITRHLSKLFTEWNYKISKEQLRLAVENYLNCQLSAHAD